MPEQTRAGRETDSAAIAQPASGVTSAAMSSATAIASGGRAAGVSDVEETGSQSVPITVITPQSGWPSLELGELWRCRDLIGQLTLRNVRVRYKQTVLGVLWAVIQPVLMMAVFVIWIPCAGGRLPNSVFVLSGLVPWFFFQTAVGTAANSVVGSEGLVTKVYFPRLAIPLSAVAAALLDLGISFVVLLALMLWYGMLPGVMLLQLPLAVALITLAAVGVGTLIAALTVSYRDFRHAVVFLLQIWMLATPAIYRNQQMAEPAAPVGAGASLVGAVADQTAENASQKSNTLLAGVSASQTSKTPLTDVRGSLGDDGSNQTAAVSMTYRIARQLARLNPMTAPIEFFRAATLGLPIDLLRVLISFVINGALCLAGLYYFRHVEDSFADVI